MLIPIWYPPSALIVSGVQSRVLRIALFALDWWGAYAAVLLMQGDQVFSV